MMEESHSEVVADPSRLTFESVWTRRTIIASYWVVVLLAIPLWWKTTSIDRLSLPGSRVRSLDAKELSLPINVDLASVASTQGESLSMELATLLKQANINAPLTIDSALNDDASTNSPGTYRVSVSPDETKWELKGRELSVGAHTPFRPGRVSDVVTRLLAPYNFQSSSDAHRVVKYSPRFRLAFTLLNEDASSGHAATSWELENSVQEYLDGTLQKLSVLHNFTVESQVQFHAPLAFKPRTFELHGRPAHGLTPEDLTVFINSAEWTLSSSVSNDPVLHFILFIPSSSNSPLYILDQSGAPTSSDAFILPQWGGIVLFNNPAPHLPTPMLRAPFTTFRQQLLSLLGVPALPAGVNCDPSEPFSDWQLDALVRHRATENLANTKETLRSIVALVKQIDNMPVGQDVRGDVQGALAAFDNALSTASSSLMAALRYSSEALELSSRAFFNPGMLALLYFPAEHKYAVYTPLFASVAAPLVASVLREILAWRKSRRAVAAATTDAAATTEPQVQPADRQKVE